MLSIETREWLVRGYERTHDAKMIAQAYGVSEREVYKLAAQMRETGSVEPRTGNCGRKSKLSEEDLKRVVGHAPFSTPKSTTGLSAIRQDGQFARMTFEGGTTKERFKEYLETVLLPSIHEGDYVIMDNLRTHHCNFVGELIRAKGAIPLYLPPYSPDLSPIEKMWAKLKSILRKWRIRIKDKLIPAILQALNLVTPSDCQGWFTCAGC